MDLRLLEVYVPEDDAQDVQDKIEGCRHLGVWKMILEDGHALVRALVRARDSQAVLDRVDYHFMKPDSDTRVMLLPVRTALPPHDAPDADDRPGLRIWHRRNQISREELYESIEDAARPSPTYVVMVVLACLVATIGLVKNDPAVVIGAMVIAPLLGPNIALALGTCLGNGRLVVRSLVTQGTGFLIVVALAGTLGATHELWLPEPFTDLLDIGEVRARTSVGLGAAALALVSGTAGALAFATGAFSVLIGVMVAVALMPPTVTMAMLAGAGAWEGAGRAGLLLLTNVVCLNLGSICTFLFHGIYPSRSRWREKRQASRVANIALAFWLVLLAVVLVLIGLWPE